MSPSKKVFDFVGDQQIIPVVTAESKDQALELAEAFYSKGYQLVEITLRTAAGLDAIKTIKQQQPNLTIAAGTVLNPEQMLAAKAAGADLQVSPGCSYDLYQCALDEDVIYVPGVGSVSEILSGIEYGFTVFKYFPAESLGGTRAIKAFASILPDTHFIPTGGINKKNVDSYLQLNNVLAVGGSWIVDEIKNN